MASPGGLSMEKVVLVERWEEEEADVMEKSLRGRQPRQESNVLVKTSTTINSTTGNSSSDSESDSSDSSNEAHRFISITEHNFLDREDKGFLAASSLPLSENVLNQQIAHVPSSQHENISVLEGSGGQDETEFYLDRVFDKPVTHDFYCPKCKSSIKKVILRGNELETSPVQLPEAVDPITSCFSFLFPAGYWFTRNLVHSGERPRNKPGEVEHPEITQPLIIPSLQEIPADSASLGADKLEILKSIVYGGLTESITSLSVVTSAASADAATLNIIALAFANLISGLFVIGHNLWNLKKEQPEEACIQTNEQVDHYQELLGQKKNFIIHATIAMLSYIVFGLVPPVVYGFTYMDSDNKDFKLAAVAAASLLCITMLAIGKAYVQKPPKSYIKTLLYYLLVGFMASGVAYVAGDLIKKLIEELGLFRPGAANTVPGRPEWAASD